MERERFVDKIALVTGGANGLGRGMVEQLVKEGAQVAIFDIEDDTMEEVFGGNDHVFCVHCDVRDYDQVQESVQKVIDRYGRIEVLMNNAGICHREPFLECSKEGWLDVMATNLNGEFYVGQAVARTMVELGVKGYIVNTSSNSSRKTIGGITPYCPSKAAVKMLTQVMALELAKYGIHVNAIAPALRTLRRSSRDGRRRAVPGFGRRFVHYGRNHLQRRRFQLDLEGDGSLLWKERARDCSVRIA